MRQIQYAVATLLLLCLTQAKVFSQTYHDTLRPIDLNEVVVSSVRAGNKTPMTYSDMDEQHIKQESGAKNIPYVLQSLPSLVAFSEDGTGVGNTSIRIRGTDATRINVTLNGMPLNNPESQEVYWVNLPDLSSSLQSMQVQRGIGTSTNGSGAFGASISLQTQNASLQPYGEASMTMGSYNTVASNVAAGTGMLKNGMSFDLRLSRTTSDGYIRNGSVNHKNIFFTTSHQTKKQLIKLNYINGIQHTGITWEGISPDEMQKYGRRYNPAGKYYDEVGNIYYYGNETDNYYSHILQLVYSRQLSSFWNLSANLNYNNGYGYYESYKRDESFWGDYKLPNQTINGITYEESDMVRRKAMANDFYVANIMTSYEKNKLKLSAGAMFSIYDGDHYGRLIWAKYNENIPGDYEWCRNNAKKQEITGFVKADYQLTSFLSVFGDVQYRHINYDFKGLDDDFVDITNKNEYNFFNPKAGLFVDINPQNKTYVSVAMANREPLRTDLKESIKGGGDKIKPERMIDYEVGYKFIHEKVRVNLNLYYMDYKNQMVQTGKLNDVGYKLMENVSDSYRTGVELAVLFTPLHWLKWDANVTLSRNKIKNYTAWYDVYDNTDYDNWLRQEAEYHKLTDISFSPNVVASSVLSVNALTNLTFSLQSKYVGKQYCDNTSSDDRSLDSYFVNNASVNYIFKTSKNFDINLQFTVNNIFNEKYAANAWMATDRFEQGDTKEITYKGFYPQATRNFMAKLMIRF